MSKRVIKSRTGEVLIKGDIVYVNETLLVKNKYDAILPPSVLNDSSEGFSAGSIWVDLVGNLFYVCVDSTLGASIWSSGGGSGGGLEVWQQTVIDVINDPPVLPNDGDRYLIDVSPTGIWIPYANYIAEYKAWQWQYTSPEIGMHLPVSTKDGGVYVYGGASWQYKKWELTTASGFLSKDITGEITLKNLNNKNIIVGNGSDIAVSYDTSLVSSDIEFSSSSVTIKSSVVEDGMLVQDYIQTSETDPITLEWSGSELSVKSTGINHNSTSGFVSDQHVPHSSIIISSELNGGLSGSGTLAENVFFKIDVENTVEKTAIDNNDLILIHDSLTDSLKNVKKQLISSKTNVAGY
jgi:hypothetical protein